MVSGSAGDVGGLLHRILVWQRRAPADDALLAPLRQVGSAQSLRFLLRQGHDVVQHPAEESVDGRQPPPRRRQRVKGRREYEPGTPPTLTLPRREREFGGENSRPVMPPEPAVAHEVNHVGPKLVQVLSYPARREPHQRHRVDRRGPAGKSRQTVDFHTVGQRLAVGPIRLGHAGEGILGGQDAHRLDLRRLLYLVGKLFDGAFYAAQVRAVVGSQVHHAQRLP